MEAYRFVEHDACSAHTIPYLRDTVVIVNIILILKHDVLLHLTENLFVDPTWRYICGYLVHFPVYDESGSNDIFGIRESTTTHSTTEAGELVGCSQVLPDWLVAYALVGFLSEFEEFWWHGDLAMKTAYHDMGACAHEELESDWCPELRSPAQLQ